MKKFRNSILMVLMTMFICTINTNAQTDIVPSFVKDSIDTYVEKALKDWQIPGVSVAIIKNGKIVLMKGYGVKEIGKQDKVDENTLFMIGSNTKAFTATALAILDAEKKLSLDDKVQKWLPNFKLYDPWVAKETNIRDLLSHRLGFETFQGDFMYFDTDLAKDEVIEKFSQLKPMYSYRSRWGYTNAAFTVAGEVIKASSGKSWADYLKEKIFLPLGMNDTRALCADITSATNRALAHTVDAGVVKKIPYGKIDNIAPAGSISSSANDMSKWVIAQLANGRINNTAAIPSSAINQTWYPHSIMGNGGHMYNRGHFALYGLGWFLEEYSGRKIVSHTGGVNGFVTSVTLIPEEKLGIVVLTNTDQNNFYESLKWEITDAYLGNPYRNYSKTHKTMMAAQEKQMGSFLQKKRDTAATNPPPALELSKYAGEYRHPIYGKMNITLEKGKLIARFEHHSGRYATVEPLGGNRFLSTFNEVIYGTKVWPFTVEAGKVKSVTVTVADFVEFTPYEFEKIK